MTLFLACIITVVVETALFWIFRYRKANDLVIIALTNVVTNVTLNTLIMLVPGLYDIPWLIILELIVVAAEYLIYRWAFGGSLRLLVLTFFANVLSFVIGIILEEVWFWQL